MTIQEPGTNWSVMPTDCKLGRLARANLKLDDVKVYTAHNVHSGTNDHTQWGALPSFLTAMLLSMPWELELIL